MKLDLDKSYNFLIVRLDHIGDVVLTLGCAEAIKTRFKNAKVFYLVNSYTAPLFEHHAFVDGFIDLNTNGVFDQKALISRIKAAKIDISISFAPDKFALPAIFKARVKIRLGNFIKLYSLLLTKRVIQNRSACNRSEALYDLELLKPLGCSTNFYPKLFVSEAEKEEALKYIESSFANKRPLVIVHPGSLKSTVEWGREKFLEVASLLSENYNVLVTGSDSEMKELLTFKRGNLKESNFLKPGSLRWIISIISLADLIVVNATGTLHIAAALGVRIVGIYPDRLQINPTRWAAFTKEDDDVYITPSGIFYGAKSYKPPSFDNNDPRMVNMDAIKVDEVYKIADLELKKLDPRYKKIAILYIALGRYDIFFNDFYESMEKHFVTSAKKTYFVFTDSANISTHDNVVKIKQEKLGWPFDTLKRFAMFESIKDRLANFDYIFFFNANALVLEDIQAKEVLPSEKEGLVFARHPSFSYIKEDLTWDSRDSFRDSYHKDLNSLACIKEDEGFAYVMGALNGGRAKEYLELISTLHANVESDLQKDVIAVWHDESHLNRYLIDFCKAGHAPKILGANFLVPEECLEKLGFGFYKDTPFLKLSSLKAKITLLDKSHPRFGGHEYLRGAVVQDFKPKVGLTCIKDTGGGG
ncbi:glycosyltransferase family 9 protein [Helicobacter sp. 11S02629-2]|uniref:glycosyltransferase family 9 protein n=1 Tax=Helicobacter sp. 11S02629-2 TaxID=1476195 RepID=UPI000BA57170|nr:glycosyltransferase family 9 protein [Helicobacter sp. 11S02629-2]PAF45289.1 hypothetical protein BKH40_03580 [Helicobacter sp. 11S02629-2]